MAGGLNKSGDDWIPQAEYDAIQARVPILCVDLLPIRAGREEIGMIRRETHSGGEGWCMIGGAVKRNEGLVEAITRHVQSTLGIGLAFELCTPEPLTVAEYFPDPTVGKLHDPRKHAVALTYAAECSGEPQARGEALEFRWFRRNELDDVQFGFGQGAVVTRVLARLRAS
jgi:ADP-ribose pyrophosphatase YjhB (NUDIX family)